MNKKNIKRFNGNAIVVEGGAMRGIFSTGVLDAFLYSGFNPFGLCIGISAGSTNLASFLAGMYLRNYAIYTDYSLRKEFISLKKFLLGGHLMDLDWLWDITISEYMLDLKKIVSSKSEYLIGVTDVETGKPVYFKPDEENLLDLLKASSSVPLLYRNFIKINGASYTDGGLSDPIPARRAYELGAKNILVLRSRKFDHRMKPGMGETFTKIFLKKYPAVVRATLERPAVYNSSIDFIRTPQAGANIIEVNPPEDFKTKRLTRDAATLEKDYESGFKAGLGIVRDWNGLTAKR